MYPYQETDKMLRKCGWRALGISSFHINMFLVATPKGEWSLSKFIWKEYIQVLIKNSMLY